MEHSLQENNNCLTGILICGHGSRNRLASEEFASLATQLREDFPDFPLEYGYLEFAKPTLTVALDRLRSRGVKRVIAIPAMLFSAGHSKNDIPAVLKKYSLSTGLKIDYGRELGLNDLMLGAAGARLKQVLDTGRDYPISETLLVVVGRGSSDPDANSNVSKITRMLVEGFGFGWGETVYSGVTFPLVEPGLRHALKLGFRRVVLLPYFLFSGVLISRIRSNTFKVAQEFPNVEFMLAEYLGAHPLVLKTFKERVREVFEGENFMNCSLCKYRSSVLGFEAEVGLQQESHHHHVEGLAESCTLCDYECTGICQSDSEKSMENIGIDHHHHHHPYPHADHPLGPVTLFQPKSSNPKEK